MDYNLWVSSHYCDEVRCIKYITWENSEVALFDDDDCVEMQPLSIAIVIPTRVLASSTLGPSSSLELTSATTMPWGLCSCHVEGKVDSRLE